MKYIEFRKNLREFVVFSIHDILKIDPAFHNQRLSEWQKKGYLKKVAKGYYVFSDQEINESVFFLIANVLYQPSYVSLETALSYYGLIPESVYSITSITSRLTRTYRSDLVHFVYRKIKAELHFGYRLVAYKQHHFAIAEIEKALLDYLYIHPSLKTEAEYAELRINKETFRERVDLKKLRAYTVLFRQKSLEKRVQQFIKYVYA